VSHAGQQAARRRITPRQAQRVAQAVLWAMMAVTVATLAFIVIYVLRKGLPHVTWTFLSQPPTDSGREGGVLPIAVGTLAVTALGVAMATPLGLGTAIYLTEYTAEGRMTRIIRFGADCLAGVPSIIFGWSILAGGLTLAFMILPTIIRTSEEAIRAVPQSHREVALSLGASKWESIYKVVVPTGLPGIVTGIILGVGRSISETAAVIFTAGSSLSHVVPTSVFDGTRTLSVHFYQLAREGISAEKAYATASVLVIAILAINVTAYALMERFMKRFR
jgi:phosphate transport system permease protein